MANNNDDWQEVPVNNHNNDDWQEVPVKGDQPYMSNLPSPVETAIDAGMGLAQGVTLGGADEGMAGLQTLGDVISGKADPTKDLASIYRQYQQLQDKKFKDSQARSPIAFGAGEIGGTLAPAILTSGAASPLLAGRLGIKALAKQGIGPLAKELAYRGGLNALVEAPLGAVQGALSSEGKLIGGSPQERSEVSKDVLGGAATAGVVGAGASVGGELLGHYGKGAVKGIGDKIDNFIADSPTLRQIKKAFEFGKEGVNVGSESARLGKDGKEALVSRDTNAAQALQDKIVAVDSQLGKDVGKSLEDATANGTQINIGPELNNATQAIEDYFVKNPDIGVDPNAGKAAFKILSRSSSATPIQLKSAIDEMNGVLEKVGGATDTLGAATRDIVSKYRSSLVNKLKDSVPEYKLAAERFENFRRLVPETLISGSTPVELSQTRLGNLKKGDEKLFNKTRQLIQGATKPGTASKNEVETLVNLRNSMKQLENEENRKVLEGKINNTVFDQLGSPEKIISGLENAADESAMLQQAWGTNPQEGLQTSVKRGALDLASTGRGQAMSLANKVGLVSGKISKKSGDLSKALFNAPEEQLRAVADNIGNVPGLRYLSDALHRGLDNKDIMKRNAAIFTILQNKDARRLLVGDDDNGNSPEVRQDYRGPAGN